MAGERTIRVSVSALNGMAHNRPATARFTVEDEDDAAIEEIAREHILDLIEWDWEVVDA